MEKLQNILDNVRLTRFVDSIMRYQPNDKPLFNERDLMDWFKTMKNNALYGQSIAYIAERVIVTMSKTNADKALKRFGYLTLRTSPDITEWAYRVNQVSKGKLEKLNDSFQNDDDDVRNMRFIVIPLLIAEDWDAVGHQNVIIVDLINKTYERFEPYTKVTKRFQDDDDQVWLDYNESIDRWCRIDFKEILPFLRQHKFEYISPMHTCGIGLQKRSHPGYCTVWSCLMVQLRLMFPNYPVVELVKMLSRKFLSMKNASSFSDMNLNFIKRYATYLES